MNRYISKRDDARRARIAFVGFMQLGNFDDHVIISARKVHRVHARNYLGQNNGKITAIAENHIDLVELVPNGSGGWMERQATVALGEK